MSAPRVVERLRPSHPTAPARHLNLREDPPMSNKLKKLVANPTVALAAIAVIGGLSYLAGRKWG